MRWLNAITDSMEMSLSRYQELMMDRAAWCAVVHGESASQCKRLRFNPWVRKIPWRRKWQPTPNSCLGNPMDRGAWWGHKRVRYDLETKTNNRTIFKNKGLL